MHILGAVCVFPNVYGRRCGIIFRWFVLRFGFWRVDQLRLIRSLIGRVFEVYHELFEDIVNLFFYFRLRCLSNSGTGDALYGMLGLFDEDSFVVRLRELEWSFRTRCELVAMVSGMFLALPRERLRRLQR